MKLSFSEAQSKIADTESALKKVCENFLETECGFDKRDAKIWSRVEGQLVEDDSYRGICFEVGAEVDYDDMVELQDRLNQVVQKIDPEAFFEPYDPGITTCYIWWSEDELADDIESSIQAGSEDGLWSVYYYEDGPKTGQRFADKDEAYEYRDEMGEDYDVEFMPGEKFSTTDDGFWLADLPKDDPDYEEFHPHWVEEHEKWLKSQKVNSAELPDYGGAFDIDPHEFFTKEECMECAQEVEDIVNADPTIEVDYVRYYDVYIVDYNRIVVDLDDSEGNEFSGQAKIDMRRIRRPQDLITKYAPELADQVIEQIHEAYGSETQMNEVEESEDIKAYDDIENPMVIDSLWPDNEPIEADDVKGTVTIDFVEYVQILKNGDWDWIEDEEGYKSEYTNEYDEHKWVDEETGADIFYNIGDAEQFLADEFDDNLYTRLPNVPGKYRISGVLEVPYVISGLEYTDDDRNEYLTDYCEIDFNTSRYTLSNFKTKKIK